MEKLKKNWSIVLLLLAIFGCVFILNIATLLSPDDYSYARVVSGDDLKITTFSEITQATKYLYTNWTGRVIPHILVGVVMTTSTTLFKGINTILFLVLLYFSSRFITRKNSYLSLILAFGFLIYGKMFGEKFAWISRKFELFVDDSRFAFVLIQYLWIFCGKLFLKKMAKNFPCNNRIFCSIFTRSNGFCRRSFFRNFIFNEYKKSLEKFEKRYIVFN